jgi:hypothetical protein
MNHHNPNPYYQGAIRQMPFRAPESLMNELQKVSVITGIPQSEILRRGVERFLRHLSQTGALQQLIEVYR